MSHYRGAVLDMDGTLYRGSTPIEGAAEAVNRLRAAGLDVLFLTNNSTHTRTEYCDRLAEMGIDAAEADVLTSGRMAAAYLASEHPGERVMAVGEDALRAELTEAGVRTTDDPARTEVLVAGLDRSADYDTYTRVLRALDPGTPFVATNPDRALPAEDGLLPGTGLVLGAIEGTTGRPPDVVAGKPSRTAAETALETLGLPAEACLLVGDRLETDVATGAAVGMTTVLVLTGAATRADVEASDVTPDHVLDSIAEIARVL